MSVRVLDFNKAHPQLLDHAYDGGPLDNYAAKLRQKFSAAATTALGRSLPEPELRDPDAPKESVDVDAAYRADAISKLREDRGFQQWMSTGRVWWGTVQSRLAKYRPGEEIVGKGEAFNWARNVVQQALDEILGKGKWETEARDRDGASKQWIRPTAPQPSTAALPEDEPTF